MNQEMNGQYQPQPQQPNVPQVPQQPGIFQAQPQIPQADSQTPQQPVMYQPEPQIPQVPQAQPQIPQVQQPIPQVQPQVPQVQEPIPQVQPQMPQVQQPIPQPLPPQVEMPPPQNVPPPEVPQIEQPEPQPQVLAPVGSNQTPLTSVPFEVEAEKDQIDISAAFTDIKSSINSLSQSQLHKYGGIVAGILLILAVFMPFIRIEQVFNIVGVSLWDEYKILSVFFIILGIIPIVAFFFQKGKQTTYLTTGATLSFILLMHPLAISGFGKAGVGFWFIVISTILLVVINVREEWYTIVGVFGIKKAEVNQPTSPKVSPIPQPQVMPTVGSPVGVPQQAPVEPSVQKVILCGNCGQPKKNESDPHCLTCGQKY